MMEHVRKCCAKFNTYLCRVKKKLFYALHQISNTQYAIPNTTYPMPDTKYQIPHTLAIATLLTVLLAPLTVTANETMTTPNYILEPQATTSFGGSSASGSYQLVDAGGEAAVGLGASGSYKLSSGYVSQLEQSIEINVLPAGLEAYYPLNTGLGVAAYDVSANSTHAAHMGSPAWVNGKVGEGALEFDGVNDYLDAGNPPGLENLSEVSWQAWVYPTNVSKDQMFISKQSADYFRIWNSKPFLSLRLNGVQQTLDSGVTISNNQWYHLAGTYDGGEMRIYINGQLAARKEVSGTVGFNSSNARLEIGHWITTDPRRFVGRLDEIKVYSRALSEDEVLDDYVTSQQGIANVLTLPRIGASVSQSVGADVVVATDAPGYDIAISQDGPLRSDTGHEIPPVAASIAFPAAWNEGVTEGLGFTVLEAIQRDGRWGTTPNFEYAAIPALASSFHSRSGLSGGAKEVTSLEFRLGVDGAQTAGLYRNRLGFTATMKP